MQKKVMETKSPKQSRTIVTDLVLPSETNPIGNMFGGELLARMDRAASIAARRHSRRIVVTVSVNHVAFNKMIPLGSVVTVEAIVSRAFKSSMEVFMDVWIEDSSIAAIIVQLTAEHFGLKSCWAQLRLRVHDDDLSASEFVRQLVGLPEGMEVPMVIAIGYPEEEIPGHDRKSLLDKKIHHNRFG